MRTVTLNLEAWGHDSFELTADQAIALNAGSLVVARAGDRPGFWRVDADSRVGVARLIDGLEIRVRPRISIPQLMFLLGYAADPRGWRNVGPAFGDERELFAAVASAFAAHAERAVTPVPLQGYVTVEDTATTLRGALRVSDQLARWPGLPLPLELAYDDYTADIAENRLVLGASELLLRLPLVPILVRQRLLRLRVALEGVTPSPPGPAIRAPTPTRLNARYRSTLALAELILRSTSISTESGKTAGVEFVFDMNKVFEDFVAAAFRETFSRHGGTIREQDAGHHLDVGQKLQLKPDLTWWRSGRCRAVIDAKYKALKDDRFPNADAYQVLAYCTGYELSDGHLVYARGEGTRRGRHEISNASKTIHVHALDLEVPPSSLLDQVAGVADRIRDGAAPKSLPA